MAVVDVLLADDRDAAARRQGAGSTRSAGETPPSDALEFVGTPAELVELLGEWSGAVDGFVVRPSCCRSA